MPVKYRREEARTGPAKILFLIDELNVGGTEKQLVWLCEKLPRQQFLPTIGVLRQTEYQADLSLDTPIVNFNWQGVPVIKNFQLIGRLRSYLAREQFDILQTQFVESEIYGSLAAFSLPKRPKLISTRRNLYHWVGDDPWRFRLGRYLVRRVDHVLANSHAVQKKCRDLEAVAKEQITVIQNAVELEKFAHTDTLQAKKVLGLTLDDFVVGVVGNWRPVKGIAAFLAAAKIISAKIPAARFVLAGQGPQEQELRELAERQGIADRTLFIKNSADVPGVIAAMDVAVQSSLSESFSNVLLEYMAAGKPIVATAVGDGPAMLVHDKTGLLVAPGDSPAMAESVFMLHGNQEWARDMGEQAREIVSKRWSEFVILAQYQDFYRHILSGRGAA